MYKFLLLFVPFVLGYPASEEPISCLTGLHNVKYCTQFAREWSGMTTDAGNGSSVLIADTHLGPMSVGREPSGPTVPVQWQNCEFPFAMATSPTTSPGYYGELPNFDFRNHTWKISGVYGRRVTRKHQYDLIFDCSSKSCQDLPTTLSGKLIFLDFEYDGLVKPNDWSWVRRNSHIKRNNVVHCYTSINDGNFHRGLLGEICNGIYFNGYDQGGLCHMVGSGSGATDSITTNPGYDYALGLPMYGFGMNGVTGSYSSNGQYCGGALAYPTGYTSLDNSTSTRASQCVVATFNDGSKCSAPTFRQIVDYFLNRGLNSPAVKNALFWTPWVGNNVDLSWGSLKEYKEMWSTVGFELLSQNLASNCWEVNERTLPTGSWVHSIDLSTAGSCQGDLEYLGSGYVGKRVDSLTCTNKFRARLCDHMVCKKYTPIVRTGSGSRSVYTAYVSGAYTMIQANGQYAYANRERTIRCLGDNGLIVCDTNKPIHVLCTDTLCWDAVLMYNSPEPYATFDTCHFGACYGRGFFGRAVDNQFTTTTTPQTTTVTTSTGTIRTTRSITDTTVSTTAEPTAQKPTLPSGNIQELAGAFSLSNLIVQIVTFLIMVIFMVVLLNNPNNRHIN